MKVYYPRATADGKQFLMRDYKKSKNMYKLFKDRDAKVARLRNKKPFYNRNSNIFWLNFNGRVTVPSVKNFQLVEEGIEDNVVLQFGKIGDDAYIMDYTWPMSAAQAFGICLSSLDHKISLQ